MVYIAKEKSTIIKGIAIMMMLCCHLFDCEHIDMCTSFFFVGNTHSSDGCCQLSARFRFS